MPLIIRSLGVAALLVAVCAVAAPAFTPAPEKVQQRLEAKYGKMVSWQASVAYPEASGAQEFDLYERGMWRRVVVDVEDHVLAAALGTGISASRTCPPDDSRIGPPVMFFWHWPGQIEQWRAMGVNVNASTYRFMEDTPCLVIGDNSTDRGANQVWLDNETFRPLRVFLQTPAGRVDIKWSGYAQISGFDLPQAGTAVLDDETTMMFAIDWNSVNVPSPEGAFIRTRFESAYPAERCSGAMPAPMDRLSDILAPLLR